MADTCVCILICGKNTYLDIGQNAAKSVLKKTDFDIFIAIDHNNAGLLRLRSNSRIHVETLPDIPPISHRSIPFLLKFTALNSCLLKTKSEQILMMDADTMLVDTLEDRDIRAAIGGYDFAMVEQKTILGSSMTRTDFLEHYKNHTLAWFDPKATPPNLSDFRYFNSGVVLGRRASFQEITEWAINTIDFNKEHQVGRHMIADQDYFQYWTNNLFPQCCKTLDWRWNHCRHWDEGFPHPDAIVLHFSNFCRGPERLNRLSISYYKQVHRVRKLLSRVGSGGSR